jgi:hypothetical protein
VDIDFLSIDVEGLDLNVLRSNDWSRYRPKIVLAEDLNADIMESAKSELSEYLNRNDYSLLAKTVNTAFYKRKDITF